MPPHPPALLVLAALLGMVAGAPAASAVVTYQPCPTGFGTGHYVVAGAVYVGVCCDPPMIPPCY